MKNILARGGIEFLAVFLGIALSLWVDDYRNKINTKNEIKSLLDALALELTENKETLDYIIKSIDYNIKFTDRLIETDALVNQSVSSKDSIWNANIIPLSNKLSKSAYDNFVSSGLIYKINDEKLIYEIQTIYESNVDLFEWWVDYETKFIEHKKSISIMAIPGGLEPPTYCLEGSCSIQLSYGTVFSTLIALQTALLLTPEGI